MNIQSIREVFEMPIPDSVRREIILKIIAEDKNAIPDLLTIIQVERDKKDELISEFNLQLSRADIFIQEPKVAKKEFIIGEIKKFYSDFKSIISHCYNQKG